MSNKLNRIYIGAICKRDLEIFSEIKRFCNMNYNISVVNLLKKDYNTFNIKHFKKKLKRYPISLIILKLFSEKSNQEIYDAIRSYAPNIPLLNSLNAVKSCESRQNTFEFIKQNCKKLNIPHMYNSYYDAYESCKNGRCIIIKQDTHNIPDLPKNDRIVGIAKNLNQFEKLTKEYEKHRLFFQEYLGKLDFVYKIYVIGRWAVSITSHNRLQDTRSLSPLDLIHIRVPIEKQLKRRILRFGRKLNMPIFGIDYVINKEGNPYIVDVNDFPSFRSIPEAVSLISDYIYNTLVMQQQFLKIPVKV
ncbi:MAG: hypothetical protein ACFFBI_10255 [Promethearchaeota archaeon]